MRFPAVCALRCERALPDANFRFPVFAKRISSIDYVGAE